MQRAAVSGPVLECGRGAKRSCRFGCGEKKVVFERSDGESGSFAAAVQGGAGRTWEVVDRVTFQFDLRRSAKSVLHQSASRPICAE